MIQGRWSRSWPGAGGLRSNLGNQSALTAALNGAAIALVSVTNVLLSRSLGAHGYGSYVFAMAWPLVLAVAAQLGWGHLVVRNVAMYCVRHEWGLAKGIIRHATRVVVATATGLMVVAAGVGWVLIDGEKRSLRTPFLLAMALVPLMALTMQREAALRGFRRVALGRVPETIVQPLVLVLLVLSALWSSSRLTAGAAVVATVLASGVAVTAGSFLLWKHTPPPVKQAEARVDIEAWAGTARSLLAVNGLQMMNLQMGVILLGLLAPVAEAARFSVASRLSLFVSFLQAAVTFPLVPALAALHARGARAAMQRVVLKANVTVVLLSLPFAIALLLGAELVLDVFGEQFGSGATVLRILVMGEVVNVASGFVAIILVNTGHERVVVRVIAVITATKLAVSLLVIGPFGAEGMAIVTACAVAAQNVVMAWFVARRLGVAAGVVHWLVRRHRAGALPPDLEVRPDLAQDPGRDVVPLEDIVDLPGHLP